jgi:hypothetical protein
MGYTGSVRSKKALGEPFSEMKVSRMCPRLCGTDLCLYGRGQRDTGQYEKKTLDALSDVSDSHDAPQLKTRKTLFHDY